MCGRVRVVAVEEEALVHSYDPAALPEVVVEEEQVLGHTPPALVKRAHVGEPRSRAEPGRHDHSWAVGGENLGEKLMGLELVDPTCVPFRGAGGLSAHSATYDTCRAANSSFVLQPHPLRHHHVV